MEMVLRLHLPLWLTKICGNVKESGKELFLESRGHVTKSKVIFLHLSKGKFNYYEFRPRPCTLVRTCSFSVAHSSFPQTPPSPSPPPRHKNRKFGDFIVLQPIVISSRKYHKKIVPWTFPRFIRIQMVLFIEDGLRNLLPVSTKFKQVY